MTRVEIISLALMLLGRAPIESLDSNQEIVSSADYIFDSYLIDSLSKDPWRFAAKIAQLNQLNITPIVQNWRYVYELPNDYLKMIRQYPHNYIYEIYQDAQMYSNLNPPVYIEYIFKPDVSRLPPYFCRYLAYKIADTLALSNAQNSSFKNAINRDLGIIYAEALAADAKNRPQTNLASQPIITNRAVSYAQL